MMGYMEDLRAVVGHRPLILPGSVALVLDGEDRVLLMERRQAPGSWGLPGGLMDLGESFEETARREVLEETGLTLGALRLLTVESGRSMHVQLPNGDEFYALTAAFVARDHTGTPTPHPDEALRLDWFPLDALPERMPGSHRRILGELRRIGEQFNPPRQEGDPRESD